MAWLSALFISDGEKDGFITLSVIPLLGSHAWGQSLEILLKDTLKMFISTLVPCFNASTVYYIDNIQNIVAFVGVSGMLKSACKIFKVPPSLISWPVSLSLD